MVGRMKLTAPRARESAKPQRLTTLGCAVTRLRVDEIGRRLGGIVGGGWYGTSVALIGMPSSRKRKSEKARLAGDCQEQSQPCGRSGFQMADSPKTAPSERSRCAIADCFLSEAAVACQ